MFINQYQGLWCYSLLGIIYIIIGSNGGGAMNHLLSKYQSGGGGEGLMSNPICRLYNK